MDGILKEWDRLKQAVIDSSSVIYAQKAGFFALLRGAMDLVTVPGVMEETGMEPDRLRIEPVPIGSKIPAGSAGQGMPVDTQVASLALSLNLPLISEDRKLLRGFGETGLPFYNSLMMLHYLLYRGLLAIREHDACLTRLLAVARYSQKVLTYGNTLYMEVLKRL